MKNHPHRLCVFGLGFVICVMLCMISQAAHAQTLGSKAQRYYDILGKRPYSSYLFDRFYNAYLDEASLADLQAFLTDEIKKQDTAAHHLFLAFYFSRQGQDALALEHYDKALALEPEQPNLLLLKAQTQARILNFEPALENLAKALTFKPDEQLLRQITQLQGQLLLRTGKRTEALKVWETLLSTYPDDDDLYEQLIELQITEGLYDQAIETSEKLLARTDDPYMKVIRQLRKGDIQQRAGSRDKALDIYSQTLSQVGQNTWIEKEICSQIEQVFRHEDDLTGLAGYYVTLQEAQPKRMALRKQHAALLSELGQSEEAITAFETILKLTPGDRDNREQYVALLLSADMRDKAITQLEQLTKDHPKDSSLAFNLASQYLEAGKTDEALVTFDHYIKLSEASEYAFLRVIRMLGLKEMKEAAQSRYEQLLKAQPDSISAREAYATYLFTNKETDKAVAQLEAIVDQIDLAGLLRITRQLAQHQQQQKALDLLKARMDKWQTDGVFMEQLAELAMDLKAYDDALLWARTRLKLATTPTELEAAIKLVVRIAQRGEKVDDLKKDLQTQANRHIHETCLLAYLHEMQGDIQTADSLMEQSTEQDSLLATYMQVRFLVMRNDLGQAAKAMEKLVALPQGRKATYLRELAQLYERDMNFEKALAVIPRWKELSPGSPLPFAMQAKLLESQGKISQSLDVLRGACLKFENDQTVLLELATAYQRNGQWADAQRVYSNLYEASESLSDKLRWVASMGQLAQQSGNLDDLIKTFETRRDHNRNTIGPYMALAELNRLANRYDERRKALLAASRLKEHDTTLVMAIADIEEQEGHWQQALKTLESIREQDKTGSVVRKMAMLHFFYGDESEGYRLLYETISGKNLNVDSVIQLADTMINRLDYAAAVRFLREQIALYPDDYRLGYLLLVGLAEDQQYQAAIDQAMALLDCDTEIPTQQGTTDPQKQNYETWLNRYKHVLPQQTIPLLRQTWMTHSVFSYRQNRNFNQPIYINGTKASTRIDLPKQLDVMHSYVITHLMDVTKYLEADQTNALIDRLKDHGIADAKLLMKLDMLAVQRNPAAVISALETFPDHEGLMGLAMMTSIGRQQHLGREFLNKSYDTFKDHYPFMAFSAANSLLQLNDEGADEKFSQSFDAFSKQDNPDFYNLYLLSQILNGQNKNITDQHKDKMTSLLIQWYDKLRNDPSQKGNMGSWMFFNVARALSREGDPKKVIAFIEEEIREYRNTSNPASNNHNMQMHGFGRQRQQLAQVPTWPPMILEQFPSHVLQMFIKGNSNFQRIFNEQMLDLDRLAPVVDEIHEPMLKMLMLHQVADDASLKKLDDMLEKRMVDEQPRVEDFYMAAIRRIETNEPDKALELLAQTRYLNVTVDTRTLIDRGILGLIQGIAEPDEKITALGKDTALRLRAGKLSRDERQQLLSIMETLGMEKEARQLEKQVAAANRTAAQTPQRGMVSVTPMDQIRKQLKAGNRDQVIQLATRQLQALVSVKSNGTYFPQQYEINNLIEFIKSSNLLDELIKQLPGLKDDAGLRSIGTAASICMELGKDDLARDLFEKVLNRKPKDAYARMQLYALLVNDQPQKARDLLKDLKERERQQWASQIIMNVSQGQYNNQMDRMLSDMDSLCELMANMSDFNMLDYNQIQNTMNRITESSHTNGTNIPHIYTLNQKPLKELEPIQQRIIQKRWDVHEKFCDILLKQPMSAKLAFSHKLALATTRGMVDDNAMKAVAINVLMLKPDPRAMAQYNQVHYYYSSDEQTSRLSPIEYLASQYAKDNALDQLQTDVLSKLTQSYQKDDRDELEQMITLYRCEPDQFVTKATELFKQTFDANLNNQQGEFLQTVMRVYFDRQIDADITPLLFLPIQPDSKYATQQAYSMMSVYQQWLSNVYHKSTPAALYKAVYQLADLLLGSADQRETHIKRYYDRNIGISGADPNSRIQFFSQLMNQYTNQEDTFHAVYSFARLIPSHNSSYLDRRCTDITRNLQHALNNEKQWDKVIKGLSYSPLFADTDYYQTIPSDLADNGSVLGMVVGYIRDMPDDKRAAFTKRLEELPDTFGRALTLHLINKNDSQAVYTFISTNQDKLDQIGMSRLRGIEQVLNEFAPIDSTAQAQLPDATKQFLEKLAAVAQDKNQAYLKELLNATYTQEISNDIYAVPVRYTNAIIPIMQSDPETAGKLMDKGISLVTQAQRSGRLSTGASTIEMWYLQRMVQEQRDENLRLPTISFVLSYAREKKIDFDTKSGNIRHYLYQLWNKAYNANRKDIAKAFDIFHADMTKYFADIDQSLFYETYYNATTNVRKDEEINSLLKWTDDLLSKNPKDRIASELAWFLNYRKSLENKEKSVFTSFIDQSILPRLSDQSVDLECRLELAMRLNDGSQHRKEPRLLLGMAELVTEMAAANKSIENHCLSQLFWRCQEDWARVEEWEASTRNLTEQINPYMIRTSRKSPNNQSNFPYGSDTMNRLMSLNKLLGQDEINTQLARVCQEELGHDVRLWCSLLNLNQKDIALSWLNLNWAKMLPGYSRGHVKLDLDDTFKEQANSLFDAIDTPDLKSLAQVMVAMSPDDRERKKSTITDARLVLNYAQPRSETAVELSKMAIDVPYRSPQLKNLVIMHLIEEPAAGRQLADHLADMMKDADGLSMLAANQSGELDVDDKLWLVYVCNALGKANTSPMEKYLEHCRKFTGDRYALYRTKSKVAEAWRKAMFDDMLLDLNADQLKAHVKVMREFLAMKVQNDYLNNSEYWHAMLICLDLLIAPEPDHAAWYDSLPKDIQTQTLRYRIDYGYFIHAIDTLMRSKHLFTSKEQRVDFLTKLAGVKDFGQFKMPPIRASKSNFAKWFDVQQKEVIGTLFSRFEYDDLMAILEHKPRPVKPEPKPEVVSQQNAPKPAPDAQAQPAAVEVEHAATPAPAH